LANVYYDELNILSPVYFMFSVNWKIGNTYKICLFHLSVDENACVEQPALIVMVFTDTENKLLEY